MIGGFFLAFDMPARQALIREIVDIKALPSAISLNSSMFNAARTIGPAFGAAVVAALGATICFGANAVSFIGIILVLIWMRSTSTIVPTGVSSMESLRVGITYAREHHGIRSVLILIALCSLFGWTYVVVLPTVPKDFYGIENEAQQVTCYGLLMSASGVGAVIGALSVSVFSRRFPLSRALVWGWLIFVAGLVGLALGSELWMGLVAMFFAGLGLVMSQTSANSLVQLLVSDHYRGRVMGLYTFLFIGIMPFGNFLIGASAHLITSRYAFMVNAGMCLIAILLFRPPSITPHLEAAHPAQEADDNAVLGL
jgi:MFS family permease